MYVKNGLFLFGAAGIGLYGVLYFAIYFIFSNTPVISTLSERETAYIREEGQCETRALSFVRTYLMEEDNGIRTNTFSLQDGPDTLSESVGLMMNYSLIRDHKDLFDREYQFLNEKLLSDSRLVKWKTGRGEVNCNAVVDDFRIIRALLEAYELWDEPRYLETAGQIQESIYSLQVEKGRLYELYDWKGHAAKKSIPLCYLDLYTMDRSSLFNEGWGEVVNTGTELIKKGRIDGKLPFFYKYYDYNTGKYQLDEEYKKGKGICMIYNLYTLIHLAEMNEDTEFFTDWLQGEMEKGKLFAWYDPRTLKTTDNMESTAVYALAAVYAKTVGREDLYCGLVDKLLTFSVTNKNSLFYGGFGDQASGRFYSFDNLTALWALAIE